MNKDAKIYVAGHAGLVGSAIVRGLNKRGFHNIIGKRSVELDLTRQVDVEEFFEKERPEYVYLCSAKVGGINANNTYPAEFIYQNMMIEANIIHACYQYDVTKLICIGSGCVYPRIVPQPIKEEYLLTGVLEKTNEAYAVAKIAGLKMCESYNKQYGTNYIPVMPCNLYGEGDKFDLQNSHVVPSLLRKFNEAKAQCDESVTIWGTGDVKREFLHVDDLADASIFIMENYNENSHINIGFGDDVSIRELAETIKEIVGFDGELVFDSSMPDGTPRKLLDSTKLLDLGWTPKISLKEGLERTYSDYLINKENYRK